MQRVQNMVNSESCLSGATRNRNGLDEAILECFTS